MSKTKEWIRECFGEDADLDPSVACDRARFACNSIKRRYEQHFQQYDKQLEWYMPENIPEDKQEELFYFWLDNIYN